MSENAQSAQNLIVDPQKNYVLSGSAIIAVSQQLQSLPYRFSKEIEGITQVMASAREIQMTTNPESETPIDTKVNPDIK